MRNTSFCILVAAGLLLALAGCGDELNSTPDADAGPDQVVETGSTVQLDGSGSSDDDDEDELSFEWDVESLPAGSTASLSNSTSESPSFTADVSGTYEFSLVVNDGNKDSDPDSVSVVATYAPVANAVALDASVAVGNVVTLDASGSTDADGDALSYSWSLDTVPTGSAAFLDFVNDINPSFTADVAGDYIITLAVSDGHLESVSDSVTVSAQ